MIEKPTHKKISLFSATALSATSMVGSGWLFSAQLNAKLSGNYSFLAWLLAALLVMAVGLCLAQVVAIFPVRGATSRSSALSHNSVFGMPFAFANWFGIMICVATEAQATTQYLSAALKNTDLMDNQGLTFYGKLFALGILFLYLVVNFYGIKFLARVNNVVTALKIFTPLFTIALFFLARFDKSNFDLPSNALFTTGSALGAIVGAGLIYSYNGFQLAVAFASEIDNPKKNVPLAIIFSIGLVMLVYMALQFAFMGAVPHDLLQSGWASLNFHSPLVNLAMLLGLNFLVILLMADSIISPSGTGYAYLGGSARMFYAMAAEGQMPSWTIGKLNPIYNLCRRSLLINWFLVAIVLWNADSWAGLMVIVSGYNLLGYMAAPISMGAIKPHTRLWGGGVFAILGIVMTTIPAHDLLMMNLSLVALMAIYGAIQLTKKMNLNVLLGLITPFVAYLWLIYVYQHPVYIVLVSFSFYWLITSPNFVQFCKKYKTEGLSYAEEILH
ncbi:MAG: APC family permease [Chthoniobacterales bacterium]|nr:APC family permease [Chthoniobacterales bacterium]